LDLSIWELPVSVSTSMVGWSSLHGYNLGLLIPRLIIRD
jgi:hypothetical protein